MPSAPPRETLRAAASGGAASAPRRDTLPPPASLLAVAAGGALGGSARVALSASFPSAPGAIPWATVAENTFGALLLGLVVAALVERWPERRRLRAFLAPGLLGAFTTFSNLTVDVVRLAADGALATALAYGLLSTLLGVGAALAGIGLGRRLGARAP